jgi:hypothetical protein
MEGWVMSKIAAPITLDHVIFSGFNNGEGMLVDLKKKNYYQLNETAVLIWRCLEKGQPVSEIICELTSAYDVSSEQAAASIERLLLHLQTRKLIQTK